MPKLDEFEKMKIDNSIGTALMMLLEPNLLNFEIETTNDDI